MEQYKCLFIGSKQLGLKALQTICKISKQSLVACITIDDTYDIRTEVQQFRKFCSKEQLKLEVLRKPSELSQIIDRYKPEICLVVGWYWVLSEKILEKVPKGFYGLHASLLPKYRGGSPLVWQIINGESEAGVSLFRFDEGMDTGDIYGQYRFLIEMDDSIVEVLDKAEQAIINLIEMNYLSLIQGKSSGRKQNDHEATYCSIRKPKDGQINWHKTALYIYKFIIAQTSPYPGAFCYLKNGDKLTIWSAQIFEADYYGIPGRVNQFWGDGIVVTCGEGAIIIHSVQVNNGDVLKAKDILKFGEQLL